jgi:nucleoside-triphosphatase THEP1
MYWLVPFERNKQFIGCYSQFKELFAKLNLEDLEDSCQCVAITGLGGVSKTQIALKAAFWIQKSSVDVSVFWISATSTATFKKGFLDIGQVLQIPGINKDKADVKLFVKTFLSQESAGRWLLIIDNADDIEILYNRANKNNKSSGSLALADYLPFS